MRRTFRSTRRETHKKAGITCSLADGIRFAWADPARRTAAAAVNRPLIETCCDRAAGLRKIEELRERAIALHREQAR